MTKIHCRIPIIIAITAALGSAEGPVVRDSVEDTRAALEKWVETRKTISKEKQDWALEREILEERIKLVQREIKSLREKISEAEKSISDTDEKRAELMDENNKLKSASEMLTGTVTELEAKTIALNKQLPDPIRERVKPVSQLLPDDPNDTQLSLAQRFQNVIGVLNEVNKFNLEITVTSERRTIAGGKEAEVTALYVGLGQAYYTGANGTIAGVGRPSEQGWNWIPADEEADKIADAVAILKNEMVAGFVPLPVKVK